MNLVRAAAAATLLLLPSACVHAPAFAAGEDQYVDVAIVFLADVSGSMDDVELAIERESHAAAIAAPEVLAAINQGAIGRIAVTYVEFAGWADQRLEWTIIDGPATAAAAAAKIRAIRDPNRPYTDITHALIITNQLFDAMPWRATRLVVDVVGDGINGPDAAPIGPARAALLKRGAVINGLPLLVDPSEADTGAWYETELAGGPGHFTMPITAIGQMPAALRRKLAMELF